MRGFFESYFSNFIEGTEWTLAEARRIVFAGETPSGRKADARDIRSTFELVNGARWATATPSDEDELLGLLLGRHAVLMAARPDACRGRFKDQPNRVGSRWFVAPKEVEGTLRRGIELINGLVAPFSGAVLTHWVAVTVHPFVDGNGRIARLAMNAELERGGLQRVVVPTAWRDDYLSAIRAMERHGDAGALIRGLQFACRWTASLSWSNLDDAEEEIRGLNGFMSPDEARELGRRLRLASSAEECSRSRSR